VERDGIILPPRALVVLVGGSGAGKSWWARRHFLETEVVSSDRCRALVSDDEADQRVNREAFAVFYSIVRQRLSLGRLTVADSTALAVVFACAAALSLTTWWQLLPRVRIPDRGARANC